MIRSLAWLLCLAAPSVAERGNCGIELPVRGPTSKRNNIPWLNEAFSAHHSNFRHPIDVEDDLYDADDQYRNLVKRCWKNGAAVVSDSCAYFGVEEWNLTSPALLRAAERVAKRKSNTLAQVDVAALSKLKKNAQCGSQPVDACVDVDGELRVSALSTSVSKRAIEAISQLEHLWSVNFGAYGSESLDLSEVSWPSTVRVLHVTFGPQFALEGVARLAQKVVAAGGVESLQLDGQQNLRQWLPLDLSHWCGLDLKHFHGFTVHIGKIPACWGEMKNLRAFYCTNCMMTSPPTALKGLQSLKSFVGFRQWEMVPCAYKDRLEKGEVGDRCRAGWEATIRAKSGSEGRLVSTGDYGDFQEGPSYFCPEHGYAFDFSEFMDLGWTNVEKVWLDGNFLTGSIPDDIDKRWPKLRSLDLYDNLMTGTIPESLAKLDMIKLQLQGNNFSGTLPPALAHKYETTPVVFGISTNPHLEGCAPASFGRNQGTADTKLRRCNSKGDEL